MPVRQWRLSQLALTLTAAQMCLNMGAPQTLSGPQPIVHMTNSAYRPQIQLLVYWRLDLADFVAQISYKHHDRVMS